MFGKWIVSGESSLHQEVPSAVKAPLPRLRRLYPRLARGRVPASTAQRPVRAVRR